MLSDTVVAELVRDFLHRHIRSNRSHGLGGLLLEEPRRRSSPIGYPTRFEEHGSGGARRRPTREERVLPAGDVAQPTLAQHHHDSRHP